MYTEQDFEFVDKLLRLSLNNDLTYSNMLMIHKLDFDLYNKLFSDINHNGYNFILLQNDCFTITKLGRDVANIGFKNYFNNLNKDKETESKIMQLTLEDLQKTDTRSKNAFIVSVIAIIAAFLIGLMQVYQTYHYNNKIENKTQNTEIKTDSTSKVNHSQLPSDSINKTSVKIISNSSKHIID